jgi:hypothetical protein
LPITPSSHPEQKSISHENEAIKEIAHKLLKGETVPASKLAEGRVSSGKREKPKSLSPEKKERLKAVLPSTRLEKKESEHLPAESTAVRVFVAQMAFLGAGVDTLSLLKSAYHDLEGIGKA